MASVKATKNGSGIFSTERAQIPHLLTHGVSGEVHDLRGDVARSMAPQAAITVDEYIRPAPGSTLTLTFGPKVRAGGTPILHEVMDGAPIVPPTGTISAAGVYAPAAPPNGTHSYAVFYEYIPA